MARRLLRIFGLICMRSDFWRKSHLGVWGFGGLGGWAGLGDGRNFVMTRALGELRFLTKKFWRF